MIKISKKRIINLFTIAVLLLSYSGLWAQQTCESMPEPVAYTRIGTATNKLVKEYADVRGVRVTRTLSAGNRSGDKIMYSNQDTSTPAETYCSINRQAKYGGKKYPFMDSNKVTKITYEFSKPVVDVEVFLAAFGYSGHKTRVEDQIDDVIFTVNKGTISLNSRSSCTANAIEVVNGNEVRSKKLTTTDAKVGITSTEPFTELTLTYHEPGGGVIGGAGFYVEICLNSIQPLNTSACNPTNINNNFAGAISATKTLNGVEVERVLDASQFANLGSQNYCGSSINYPANLPYMGDTGAKKLTYKFKAPVTSAEIFLFAFGESEDTQHPNRYDQVKFSINGEGTMTLSQTYNCIPTGTTVNSSTGVVKSADNKLITTDVGIKVSSTKPFTEIVLDDLTPTGTSSGKGYLVEICASSITKANVDDFITLDAGISNLTNQTVCDGEAPVYKAKADATAFASTAKFDYILQAKKSGTTNWVTVETKANVTPGTVHTFTGDALKTTDYNNAKVRVKYVYKNSLFPSVTGTAHSNEVTLTVKAPTVITTSPQAAAYCVGSTATPLSVVATGEGTLNYKWYSNTVDNTTTGTLIPSATTATFTPPTAISGTTYYYAEVTGSCGQVKSATAKVEVLAKADLINIIAPAYTPITVCANEANTTITANANLRTGVGNRLTYTLQYSATGAPNSFTDHPTQKYTNFIPSADNTKQFVIKNEAASEGYYRVKYTSNGSLCSGGGENYSNVFKFTVTALPEVTAINANPPAFSPGVSTSVSFTIEGTPNAVVTYRIGSGSVQTTTLDATGNSPAIPAGTHTQTVELSVSKITLGGCEQTYTNMKGRAVTTTTQCFGGGQIRPARQFPFPVAQNQNSIAPMNGVNVIREYGGTPNANTSIFYQFCSTQNYPVGYTLVDASSTKVTYVFDKPIKVVEIWLMLMSDSGGGLDRMKLSTNNGNLTFTKVYDCYGNAIVAANGEVSASNNVTDVAVKVTSDKPFTKLTVLHTSASTGALVELCPASVQPVELIDITQHPQSQTTCETLSPTFTSKAVLKNGATGTVKYKWQESTNNGVSWVDAVSAISATSGTIASGGTTSLNLFNITKNTPNKQYRVLYTYELLPGVEVTKASTPATLTVNDKVEITEFKASPNTIVSGVATPVTITIKGTPNAVVTYTIDGGTPETVTLTGGVHTFTRTISQTTDVAITQLEKNCTVNPDLHLKIGESGESCGSLPSPQFGATVTGTNKQMMGSVEVTRTFSGGAPIATTLSYSGICLPYYPIGYAILRKQTSNASKVTYRFSQPVTSAEVWLLVMSNTPLSPGIDKAKITTNCSSTTLTKVYDCSNSATLTGNTVASADRVNTDVAIRVESSDTFTELYVEDLWDSSTGNGAGFLVELCPSSVKPVTIDISKHPLSASVCSGQTVSLSAVAALKGLPANTPMSYQWEQSANGTAWSNVTGTGASGTTTTGSVTYTVPATLTQTTHYRLKYSYTTSCGAVTVKATTNAAIITINELPKVTKVEATPGYILNGASTPISFTITGTANATVTYTLNGGAPLTAQINGSGVATVPYTTTQDVTLNVTKIEKNGCITSITDKFVTVGVSKCAAFPAPQFGASVTGSNKQTMSNVEVTRSFDGGTPTGSPSYGTQCSGQPYSAGYILLRKETSNASKVTYHFSQPVTSAEVWLLLMSNQGVEGVDKAKITTNCGSATLTKIYDCSNTATLSGDEITSTTRIFTDVAIRVESVKPFTELYVEDLWTTGSGRGFMVELCPSSLVVANTTGILSVATQPANVSACQGGTASIVSKANVGTAYLGGTLTYQWEESANNGATWVNATGASATGTATPGLDVTYTLSNVASASPNKQYRVKYSYIYNNSFCGEATITSAPATLTVVPKPATPTVQTKTECPATGNFDMATLVTSTVPAGHTLKWYTDDTGNTAANPQVDRNKTAKTTYEKWVALATSQGCESDRVKVTYIVDITTQPTITAPTNNLSINCADSAAAINTAVTAWLNTATATVGCGTANITNNYAAVKPTDLCSVGEIEVTFTVTDAFGTQKTEKKKITVNRLIANNDTATVARSTGGDINVLSNDSVNGAPATTANAVVSIVNANGTGATVTSDGKVHIPGGTLAPGTYNITYKICDKNNPSLCGAPATIALTVNNSSIQANNDDPEPLTFATSVAYAKNADSSTFNVLANDRLSGVAPNTTQVDIIPVTTATGVSIESDGRIEVAASTPAGVYTLTYKIKEKNTTNESAVATVTVKVKNTLTATPATLTPSITPSTSATTPKVVGDVLNQTALNGNKPNTSQVDITVTQHATPPVAGDPVPSINTTTGKVEIPSGVKPGTYTIKYKLCDKVTPQTCTGEVTLPITVAAGNTIVAQNDDFSSHKVEHSSSEEVVKNGSNPVNVLTNDKLDTRTGLDTNVVTITQTSPTSAVNIDTATGQIKVAANTPAGVYEVKYKITEKGQTTASNEATAKVVVINKVELDPAAIPATVNPPTDSTPKTIANVLHKAKINGNVPTISDATVEVVTPAPAAPGEVVPYVDPATGNVVVPPGTKVGNHPITYKVCDKVPAGQEAAQTCKTTTITIPVTGNTPTAVADNFSAHKVERSASNKFVNDGTNDVNVLSNDALGSNTNITTALVTINQTGTTNPGVTIDTATGKVKVAANTPAGEYTVKYTLTQKGGTTPSAEVPVKVVVTNKLELGPGNVPSSVKPATGNTPAEIGDVLDGTKLNGTPTTVGTGANQVTIAVVTPATPQGSNPVPTLDPATGKVKIPAGVPAGPYTIKYKICDNATPASAKSCEEKTLTINVAGNNITPIADDFSTFKVEKPAANTFVKNGANDVNVLTNDKLGDRIGLDTNVVEITQTSSTDANVGIDVATGKVKVGPGANAGEHTITYTLKEKGQSNVSTPVTVKVTVTNKVEVTPATIPTNPSVDSTTPKEIGNVLNQTTINGSTPSINDVTITATPSAPGSPKKPYIDTTTGKVMIPSGVAPGDHTISYTICDNVTPASAKTCETATITVKVTGNTITPEDDDFSAYKVEHPTTQTVVSNGANHLNILTNDKLGSRTGLTKNEVTITQTHTSDSRVSIDTTNGEVDVQAGTPAGEYTVKYKITEKGQPTSAASVEKTVKVVVTNKLVNNNGNYGGAPSTTTTPADGGNVLDNVRINGAISNPSPSDVDITINQTAGSGIVPYLETSGADKGKIKLPQGTPSGTYTIKYTVCDTATGAAKSCKQATATVVVDANAIIAQNDTDNKDVEFNANTAQNVKGASNNDLNVLDNDKLGATTGLNNTQVTIQTTQSEANITIQPDGKVQVAAGKAAGVYELRYKIKDNINPTNISQEATVKVVVKNKVTNDPFPATQVKPSTDKNTPAERINILDKVKINGSTPSINDVTIEVITGAEDPLNTDKKVPVLNTTTGKVEVPAGVEPGAYTIKYKVCDKVTGEANSCVVHEITVNVAGNDITAMADDFSAYKVERSNTDAFVKNGTNEVNVLTNDVLGSRTGLDTDVVTITQTDTTEPKVTIDRNTGKVKVAANAPAGTHTVKYTITEKGQTTASAEVEVKVVVTNKIELDHTAVISNPVTPSTDHTNPKEIGDVLDGTKLNGTKPTIGTGPNQVTVTVTNRATSPVPGDPVPELEEAAGKVKIPAGVKPGNYNITYKVCDNATPQTCETTTITVQVQGNTTTAVGDDFSAHKVEHPTTNTFVNDGTNDVNVLSNDKLGNNSNITTNEVTITQTDTSDPRVNIDTATGKVKVDANTPVGEYTVKYKFTEKGQTIASEEKEVKVVVSNKLVNSNANYGGAPSTNSTPANGGNVLDNVRINNATSNPAPNDVTITVDVPATGTTVPYLETSGPDAGKIKIPQGTPSGTYTINYTVCDKAPGAAKSCKQATATVTVGTNPIVVNPITKRVPKTGGSVDVLDNVTIGGDPATKDNVDISITDDDGTGATVDPTTGKINVPSGLAPGEHIITYKVCEKGSTTNCQTNTLKVVVPANIVLNPDTDKSVPKTGGTVDVIGNDTVNGTPATKDNVDISIVDHDGTNASIDPATGKIVVPNGVAPGEYTITYKVCEKGQTDNCETGTVKVVVPADLVLTPDNDVTVPKTGGTVDVLGNDTINGTPATKDNVDISIVDPDGTNASIDPATGKIVIPDGATPGEHTIRYKVCEKGTNRCEEGTVKVVVAQENIVANADNYEQQWSATETVVKDARNREVNVLTNDQLASNRSLSTILVDIEQVEASSDKVSIDTATGKVKIAAGAPAGTYTLKYTIKPKGQATPISAPAIVTVVVKNKVEVTDDEISGTPSDSDTPKEIGNVTDNIEINGQKPNPSDVAIEVIDPAHPVKSGASVPTIDTTTGKITVGKDVPPGDYTIKVRVCDKATPATCVEEDYKIRVRPNQDLEAVNDKFKIGTTGGTTPSVLENDKWKGEAGKLNTDGSDDDELKVEISDTSGKNQPAPTYIHKGTDGRFTIEPGLAPGKYTYYYTIKSIKTGMTSDAKVVFIVSPNVAAEDTFTVDKPNDGAQDNTSDESVLDNDTLNGQKAKPEDVNITLISVSDSADGKIELDTTTGKIKVKPGAPIGEHTVKYKVCPKESTTGCLEGEAKVKVQPNLTLKELTLDKPINSAVSETHTDSVLTGSTLDGQPISPSDVTMEIKSSGGLDGVDINADGQIIIPKGARSGTYTIEYKVKSNAYGVEKIGRVTVTITNDADLEFYNAISTDEGSQNNGFIIKNIDLYPNNNLKIFNRYGVLVYEKDGYTNTDPFKGISTGRATVNKDGKLPQGTYYYVLEYTDGQNQKQQKAGWLYIK